MSDYRGRRIPFKHLACGLMLVSLATPVAAQTSAQADADAREIASYQLTMESIRKIDVATRAMFAEMAKDPRVQALRKVEEELETLEKKDDATEADDARIEALREQKEKMESENRSDFGDAD